MPSARARAEFAPAKVNLTLRVIGRRPDGYHEIESLVVFAGVGDRLTFVPGDTLELAVRGPTAKAAGQDSDNLVLKAARLLGTRVKGLKLGRFTLDKRLPVAAGLGGGSSDAAAALRLLARHNGLALNDPRLHQAARSTGADVPVCLDPRPRLMSGIGEILTPPYVLPRLPAVLVNPGVPVATKDVFAALRIPPATGTEDDPKAWIPGRLPDVASLRGNDLEAPAIKIAPIIADVLAALRASEKCLLARMSGSGATCFGVFRSGRAATVAARALRTRYPGWWVRATIFVGR